MEGRAHSGAKAATRWDHSPPAARGPLHPSPRRPAPSAHLRPAVLHLGGDAGGVGHRRLEWVGHTLAALGLLCAQRSMGGQERSAHDDDDAARSCWWGDGVPAECSLHCSALCTALGGGAAGGAARALAVQPAGRLMVLKGDTRYSILNEFSQYPLLSPKTSLSVRLQSCYPGGAAAGPSRP